MLDPDEQIVRLGIVLPPSPPPMGAYRPFIRDGGLVYLSGVAPREGEALVFHGRVGADLDLSQAQEAARLCAVGLIANLRAACEGDLRRVRQILMLRGYVNAAPTFTDIPLVTNGASALFLEVFGVESGAHARTSIGCSGLPSGVAVEVDAQVRIG